MNRVGPDGCGAMKDAFMNRMGLRWGRRSGGRLHGQMGPEGCGATEDVFMNTKGLDGCGAMKGTFMNKMGLDGEARRRTSS